MAEPGTGPGVITPDGCAVDLYRVLPAMGEPEIVHGAIPAGAGILELGAGAGRVTHRLVAATAQYQVGERVWTQTLTAERLDSEALGAALAEAGLAVDAYLTGDGSWVRAVPVSSGRALGRSPR